MLDVILQKKLKDILHKYQVWTYEYLKNIDTQNTIDKPLYHYTDANGLKGILESQTIWFTDFRHLNDPSELSHGMKICSQQIEAFNKPSTGINEFLEIIKSIYLPKCMDKNALYLACFSQNSDELGQWRAYGNDGRGYSIGFSPSLFQPTDDTSEQKNENAFCAHVLYKKSDFIKRNKTILDEACSLMSDAETNSSLRLHDDNYWTKERTSFMLELAMEAMIPMMTNCMAFKHEAYKHECETRMFMIGLAEGFFPHLKTRSRKDEIVPFVPYKLPLLHEGSVTEIIIGPASSTHEIHGVKALLKSLKYKYEIPIRKSDIPYRPL